MALTSAADMTSKSGKGGKLQVLGMRAVANLFQLVRNVKMYDPDNEVFNQPFESLRETINTIVAVDNKFHLNAVNTSVYLNGKQLRMDFGTLSNVKFLTEAFKEADVGGLEIDKPVQLQELRDFIWVFSPKTQGTVEEDGAEGHKLVNIKVGKWKKIVEMLDKIEAEAMEVDKKVDRKKYALTVYARTVYYMNRFIERLQTGGQLPSMKPAARLVQDLVDICAEQRAHFLGMTTTRSKENYLTYHSVNTCLITIVFGNEMEFSRAQLHELGMAALFHDIGMAEVDTSILNKQRQLTPEERRIIDLYPLHTVKTLLKGRQLDAEMITRIIAAYESKVDYSVPMRDKNGKLKLMLPKVELGTFGRMINISACYDALTSHRPFREAYGPEIAMTLMVSDMKYKFDPWLLRVFQKVMAIQPIQMMDKGNRTIQIG